jgi:hypothetical protein
MNGMEDYTAKRKKELKFRIFGATFGTLSTLATVTGGLLMMGSGGDAETKKVAITCLGVGIPVLVASFLSLRHSGKLLKKQNEDFENSMSEMMKEYNKNVAALRGEKAPDFTEKPEKGKKGKTQPNKKTPVKKKK